MAPSHADDLVLARWWSGMNRAAVSPAEIYVSGTVRDLVIGSPIEFDDRGTHQLKGIPGDWEVLAVSDG